MGKDCHRCGSPLVSPEAFCANCGAPQLRYLAEGDPVDAADAKASGPREIQWKQALGAALTFALPVGILCSSVVPLVSAGCCLWVLAGAVAAIGLYQRRSAVSILPRPLGRRIGVVIGLMTAAVAVAVNAGALVVQRYAFHGGDAMEKAFQTSMEQVSVAAAQLSSASPAESRTALQFLLSPDGRAASALLSALLSSLGITVFSMIGGALGTRIFSGRNASLRNT